MNTHLRDNLNVVNPFGATLILDGGGGVLSSGTGCSSGSYVWWEAPMAGCLQAITVFHDAASSTCLQVWKDSYANFPPASNDSICGASTIYTGSAVKSQLSGANLAAFTSCAAGGDILVPRVIGACGVTRAAVCFQLNRR